MSEPTPQPDIEQTGQWLTDEPWSVGGAIGLVGLMIVATVASAFGIVFVRGLGLGDSVTGLLNGLLLASGYLLLIVAVWVDARRRGVRVADSIGLKPLRVRTVLSVGLALAVAGRALEAVWDVLLALFGVRLPGSDIDPTQALGDGVVSAVMLAIVGIVLAPVVEEIVFRGVLLPALGRRWSTAIGVVASSLAFGVIHLSLYAIVPIFGLAVLLALGFVRTRSLWVPIVAHAMFNAVAIGALLLLKA